MASHVATRRAFAPVERLRERVRGVRLDAPSTTALAAPESFEELEELRVALAELIERLVESLGHARAFAAEAAHELRTPLAAISGELELLAETSGQADAHAPVRRQVDDLIALVQRLLALATPVDAVGVGALAIDLSDLIADEVGRRPPEEAARLCASADPDVLVRGDESLLAASLANAVGNALKFSDGPVRIRATAAGGEAWLDVVDEGPGIPASERDKVFAPFYRTATARRSGRPGHGVGLSLIAHVARAHGGSVELLEGSPGTHLRIRLPRWGVPARPGGTAEAT